MPDSRAWCPTVSVQQWSILYATIHWRCLEVRVYEHGRVLEFVLPISFCGPRKVCPVFMWPWRVWVEMIAATSEQAGASSTLKLNNNHHSFTILVDLYGWIMIGQYAPTSFYFNTRLRGDHHLLGRGALSSWCPKTTKGVLVPKRPLNLLYGSQKLCHIDITKETTLAYIHESSLPKDNGLPSEMSIRVCVTWFNVRWPILKVI